MKTKHYKITVIICIFVLLFSLLTISSFASEFNGVLSPDQEITLSEDLNFEFTPDNIGFYFITIDDPDTFYNNIYYTYPGRHVLSYVIESTQEQVTVYDSDAGGWVNDSFRHLIIKSRTVLTDNNLGFFSLNLVEETPNIGIYDAIYGILSSTIYGDRPLTSTEDFVLTLLASIACVSVVALPIIAVFWATKFMFTLGRNW